MEVLAMEILMDAQLFLKKKTISGYGIFYILQMPKLCSPGPHFLKTTFNRESGTHLGLPDFFKIEFSVIERGTFITDGWSLPLHEEWSNWIWSFWGGLPSPQFSPASYWEGHVETEQYSAEQTTIFAQQVQCFGRVSTQSSSSCIYFEAR